MSAIMDEVQLLVDAELERRRGVRGARIRLGRRQKAERGGFIGGNVPYGYRNEGKELVPNPVEQKTIRYAKQLRTQGKSLRAIASALDAKGYAPRKATSGWKAETVASILGERKRRSMSSQWLEQEAERDYQATVREREKR